MEVIITYKNLEFKGIYTPGQKYDRFSDTPPLWASFELDKVFKNGEDITEMFNEFQDIFDVDPVEIENKLINEYENYIL